MRSLPGPTTPDSVPCAAGDMTHTIDVPAPAYLEEHRRSSTSVSSVGELSGTSAYAEGVMPVPNHDAPSTPPPTPGCPWAAPPQWRSPRGAGTATGALKPQGKGRPKWGTAAPKGGKGLQKGGGKGKGMPRAAAVPQSSPHPPACAPEPPASAPPASPDLMPQPVLPPVPPPQWPENRGDHPYPGELCEPRHFDPRRPESCMIREGWEPTHFHEHPRYSENPQFHQDRPNYPPHVEEGPHFKPHGHFKGPHPRPGPTEPRYAPHDLPPRHPGQPPCHGRFIERTFKSRGFACRRGPRGPRPEFQRVERPGPDAPTPPHFHGPHPCALPREYHREAPPPSATTHSPYGGLPPAAWRGSGYSADAPPFPDAPLFYEEGPMYDEMPPPPERFPPGPHHYPHQHLHHDGPPQGFPHWPHEGHAPAGAGPHMCNGYPHWPHEGHAPAGAEPQMYNGYADGNAVNGPLHPHTYEPPVADFPAPRPAEGRKRLDIVNPDTGKAITVVAFKPGEHSDMEPRRGLASAPPASPDPMPQPILPPVPPLELLDTRAPGCTVHQPYVPLQRLPGTCH